MSQLKKKKKCVLRSRGGKKKRGKRGTILMYRNSEKRDKEIFLNIPRDRGKKGGGARGKVYCSSKHTEHRERGK